MIGRVSGRDTGREREEESEAVRGVNKRETDMYKRVPSDYIIFSLASKSVRKPQLGDLLSPYLPEGERERFSFLELFARNVTSGWTSWGNQVVRFQAASLFTTH